MALMHKIQDPQFAERVRARFARQSAMTLIGATLPVVEAGYTEIHLPCKPDITQQQTQQQTQQHGKKEKPHPSE
jgi:hypothetical protein